MLVATDGMHGVVWQLAVSEVQCLPPISVPHLISVGGHIRPTSGQVNRYIIQSISKSALYLHIWVDYMHVLLLNK